MHAVRINAAKWQQDLDGTWLCLRCPAEQARKAMEIFEPGKVYDAEIKRHCEKRSLDANAYCWVLLDKLAEKLEISKTEIYRGYIREIGGNSETVCVLGKADEKLCQGWTRNGIGWQTERLPSKIEGCVNIVLYYGSSTYDTAQMSRLINLIVQDCKALGIETMAPQELDMLLNRWGGQ